MDRREYLCPSIELIDYMSEQNVICASLEISDDEINTEGRTQIKRRGTWGDLWAEDDSDCQCGV